MSKFSEMFRESPFDPLREHMGEVMKAVACLEPLFEAVQAGDTLQLDVLTKDVFTAEHEADVIKDEIRQSIPRTFFLPVFRGDLLGYLKEQDDMADAMKDIAFLLTIKKLTLPASLADETFAYVSKVLEVCRRAAELSDYLKVVVERGFSVNEIERATEMISAVEKAEWTADRAQYRLSQGLFALEDELRATDILLWFNIYGYLGKLANAAEKTGDRIRRMLTTH